MKLFCKPIATEHDEILYSEQSTGPKGTIAFRSMQLANDVSLIHYWVNQPYAKKFWGLTGSLQFIEETYESVLQNKCAHSFIGLLNNRPVCQIDLYLVAADELKDHVKYEPDDCGLHLLMAPPRELIRGTSLAMLKTFINFYFTFPMAQTLYAEPDRENLHANLLAQRAGFTFQKSITLSYKKATLYRITRDLSSNSP